MRKQLAIEINRTNRNPKEAPIPLVNKHALKLTHLYELTRKMDTIPGNIVECGVGQVEVCIHIAYLKPY